MPQPSELLEFVNTNNDIIDFQSLLSIDGRTPAGFGAHGDIYSIDLDERVQHGRLKGMKGIKQVAVKVFRSAVFNAKRLKNEMAVWQRLSHSNILPLIGFLKLDKPAPGRHAVSLVTVWMKHGTVRKYTSRLPETPRIPIVLGIANGLRYLHSQQIVHGDLKGENVLIDDEGNPRLCDFGLSSDIGDTDSPSEHGGSLRWMAPELLNGMQDGSDFKSDIWSFGMTAFEISTDTLPYSELVIQPVIRAAIVQGRLPTWPSHIPALDEYWNILQCCWTSPSEARPYIEPICSNLERLQTEPSAITKWTKALQTFKSGITQMLSSSSVSSTSLSSSNYQRDSPQHSIQFRRLLDEDLFNSHNLGSIKTKTTLRTRNKSPPPGGVGGSLESGQRGGG